MGLARDHAPELTHVARPCVEEDHASFGNVLSLENKILNGRSRKRQPQDGKVSEKEGLVQHDCRIG